MMKKLLLSINLILGFVLFSPTATAQYCTTSLYTSPCSSGDLITSVTLGTYTNAPTIQCSPNNFGDFTTDTISLAQGSVNNLSVIQGPTWNQGSAMWVDWNKDGDWDDAGEFVWSSSVAATSHTGTMAVPLTALVDSTYRLRVRCNYSSVLTSGQSCTGFTFGEAEDYTIKVTPPPVCPAPLFITSNAITSSSAWLFWQSNGVAFNTEYGLSGFTQGTGTSGTSLADSVQLTGLTANTMYDFYVQNNCTSAGNGSSLWSGPHTFTTSCVAISTYPNTENFDGSAWSPTTTIDQCWSLANQGSYQWFVSTGGTPSFATGPLADHTTGTTGNYLFTESSSGFTNDTAWAYTPDYDLTSLSVPLMTFYYHMHGAAMGTLLVQASTNGSTWTTVATLSGQKHLNQNDPWLEETIDLSSFNSTATKVRFAGVRGTSFTSDISIDDVKVQEAPACPKPTGVTFTNITSSGADINFFSGGHAFPIEWGPTGFTQGTGTQDTALVSPHSLTGMFANTLFDVYIQNDCTDSAKGTSVWAGPFTFRTLCSPFSQGYTNNFDALTVPDMDPCWTLITQGGTTPGNANSYAPFTFNSLQAKSTPNVMRVYNGNSTFAALVTPELTGLDGDTSQIRFQLGYDYFNMPANMDLIVGTLSNLNDTSSFVAIDTLTPAANNTWEEFTVLLDNVPAGHKYVAFIHSGSNQTFTYFSFDDFNFEAIPSCLPPSAHTVVIADLDSISLTWTGGNNSLSNIEYGPCGYTQGTGAQVTGVQNGAATINNLTSGTCYDIYIQNDCGAGSLSPWYGPIQVNTLVCPSVNMCAYKFIMYDSFGDGWNGAKMGVYQNNILVGEIGSTFTTGNWDTAYVSVCDSISTSLIVTDAGSFPTEVGVEIVDPFGVSVYTLTNGFPGITAGQVVHTYTSYCTPPSCPDPQQISAILLQGTSANIGWNIVGNANQYKVEYGPTGFTQGTGGGTVDSTNTNSYLVTGLTAVTCYDIYVQTDCGTNGSSSWVGPYNFCTTVTCPAPLSISDSATGTTSTYINWISGASSWQVSWGPGGSAAGVGTVTVVNGTPQLQLTGLTDCSPYTVWVRDICGTGDTSLWTGPYNFTTDALSQSLPFVENFNFGLGCWQVVDGGTTNDTWAGITSYGFNNSTLDGTPFGHVDSDAAGSGSNVLDEELISPPIDASGTLNLPLTLEFDQYYNNLGDTSFVDVWDGTQWVNVLTQSTDAGSWTAPDHQSIVISSYANANLKVRFRYKDYGIWAWYWAIDNVEVHDVPSCPAPTALTASNMTASSAQLSWTTGGASNWNIEYGATGFVPGTGTFKYNVTPGVLVQHWSNVPVLAFQPPPSKLSDQGAV